VNPPKIVVHTDIILEHLEGTSYPSDLRKAMGRCFCYTTVFQAIDLFSMARTRREIRAVSDAMGAIKVLGLNPKNAWRYGALASVKGVRSRWQVLIAGLCIESRLPLLTNRREEFAGFRGLVVISPGALEKHVLTGATHRRPG
jgi:predicted nucleic acid-binding protein